MNIEAFSNKWFIIYYLIAGFLLIISGLWLILKKQRGEAFLISAAEHEKPPQLFITILKYLFLFTLPGLILSIIHFSWIELLFSFWSLLLIYIGGIQLVRWEQTKTLIKTKKGELIIIISRCGAIMISVGFVMFLLAYLVIQNASL